MEGAYRPERRQSPRTSVLRPARVRLNDWSRLAVEVIDVSRDGFSARSDALPRVGNYVTLEVPGIGRVEARVVWCDEEKFGARFIRPIQMSLCGWAGEGLPIDPEGVAPEIAEVAKLLASRAAAAAAATGQSEEQSP
jgi:hypothetical protein